MIISRLLKHKKRLVFILLGNLGLSSCAVGPNYVRPMTVVSPKFKEAKGTLSTQQIAVTAKQNWRPIQPQDAENRGKWWLIFKDPLLNDLEEQLHHYNQNIVTAEANYRQALAIVDEARASFFPTLTSEFSLFRQKQGGASTFISSSDGTTTTGLATTTSIATPLPTRTNYSAILSATWEPDIWGLVRRTVEADVATAQSNAALVAVTRLSAEGSLAQYYFELRTLDKDQKLLNDTVKAYKKTLRLTQNQYKSGVAARADIVQAQSQLESAQALALNNGILRGQYEHAIAILIGRPPAYLTLKYHPLKLYVPNIPIEIPSQWLQRRPDIAQAERLVQNASALIGVAIAAYYPNLTLSGSASAAANSFHQLIHTPTLGWSVGSQLSEIIYDGGFRRATVYAAKAAYVAKIATYRQTVLTAFQDVEDNLIALRILKEQRIFQRKAANSAQFALKLVTNQYKAGTVAYTNVVSAQIIALSAQKTANDVDGLLMTAAVGLIKSLGGGWNNEHLILIKPIYKSYK